MLAKWDITSMTGVRNRGTLFRIVVIFLASCSAFYFASTWTGSIQELRDFLPTSTKQEAATPVEAITPHRTTENPYKDVDTSNEPGPYSRILVIAKTQEEDVSWIESEVSDLLPPHSNDLTTAIYVADNTSAPLHPQKNKGHEASVYLTYILDHYTSLPDVSIFMHAHPSAWHNNDLLSQSSALLVRHLSSEKVLRDGYMNLRCHWEPGCPAWIRPSTFTHDDHKLEESAIAAAFPDLYPSTPLPHIFAQPCCAQFAVSRDRILALPRERYQALLSWLENTPLPDSTSGRVFEYTWQYLFTAAPIHCRNMHLCYCDAYSLCFASEEALIQYMDVRAAAGALSDDLDKTSDEEHRAALEAQIAGLRAGLERRVEVAAELGRDREGKFRILREAWDELTQHPGGHLVEKYVHFGGDSDI